MIPVYLTNIDLYTTLQKRQLRIIGITFSSMSIFAGIVMMYWYIQLHRRTFRHTYFHSLVGR